jgi:hypothetical protein
LIVFLLTDGQVDYGQRTDIINLARTMANHESSLMRVHTFGVGTEFDEYLVKETAKAGRGSFSLAKDVDCLNKQVILALKRAQSPSLGACTFQWNNGPKQELNEMFRDESFTQFAPQMMSIEEFKRIKVTFYSSMNPITKQPINLEFGREDFLETDMPLFQM